MQHQPRPIDRPFWTPGVLVLLGFMIAGAVALLARFIGGLGYATNLSNATPWGIWIGLDVGSGVALAAGGFTTAALAHIFGRRAYEAVTRPALLTAALGYSFVAFAILVDIGRSWAIWKPMIFHNYNSALFEVAMCVMTYLTVLWIEMVPILAERFGQRVPLLAWLDKRLSAFMWVFIILGVVLSCMHQSSLGTLMVIAQTKMHVLWNTPFLPLLFLLSAFAVGYPMVIVETNLATTSLRLDNEMDVLGPLSRFTIVTLGAYLLVRLWDVLYRGALGAAFDGSAAANSFLAEVGLGVILPWILLLFPTVRGSRRGLFFSALLIVGGVVLNRVNVFIVAYTPHTATSPYFPAMAEILVTAGAVATIMFLYRVFVTWTPVLSAPKQEEVAS
ncbi:Ni/Fe-hydrogenase 2 integral membrane subunit HybB [Paucidesulfovibrio gracilis DSM 16080]|uniref:Ni/Fe-hydrogenase 2 integral membrane subunit HybB n=1 Tax=Paucidesulfovibrio gracilis DSM 16080 TaxID=1121449 RepID=A0A1T4XQI4_9BACT|nr:Ni/Fe-hydrogenase cytochrome b subunit [Paucidesulfovibrio gracilis]SKA91797.1 Ni/Fe-hydrogenase 2 integral membrane subunit HybB [Paucidesulfovibrio gracilis DSM 16080]